MNNQYAVSIKQKSLQKFSIRCWVGKVEKRSSKRVTTDIIASVLIICAGFFAAWFSKTFLKIESDAVYIAVLLLPIIAYVIFSGRLKELKAGGLEASFVTVAEQSVEIASETIEPSTGEMEVVAKEGIRELEKRKKYMDESKPIVLTLTLGRPGYNREVMLQYLEVLSRYRNFKFVVILNATNNFVAYIPSWAVMQILRLTNLGYEFVDIISQGNIGELRRYPGVVTKTISTKTTNLDALREMTSHNLEALVVTDENMNLKGVVEREQIISKLLLGIAK